jgi:hypothetical protein
MSERPTMERNEIPMLRIFNDTSYDKTTWLALQLRPAIRVLQDISLVKRTETEDGFFQFSMHTLVHSWARYRLSRETASSARILAFTTMVTAISLDETYAEAGFRREMEQHIFSWIDTGTEKAYQSFRGPATATILPELDLNMRMARTLQEAGRACDAKLVYQEIINKARSVCGRNARPTVETMAALGSRHQELGEYRDAYDLLRFVLSSQTKTYGRNHVETVKSQTSMRCVYST